MSRPAPALVTALMLLLAGCSDGDDGPESSPSSLAPPPTVTAPAPSGPPASEPPTNTTAGPTAPLADVRVQLTPVADLDEPTALAVRPGADTLYVAEQEGRIRAVADGELVDEPVLDLTDLVGAGGERGLLGLDFAPDGGHLYVHYTNREGDTRVDELAVGDDGRVDVASRRQVLAVDQPQGNHNGGQLGFGPDGLLYLGLGDGGGAGDEGRGHAPGGNGQSLGTLLGKILRLDPRAAGSGPYAVPADNPFVGVEGARPEIWVYGLRNPWRFSFDRATGDLWIGDVGQNRWEEIDLIPAGAAAGANLGWNLLEGTHEFRGAPPPGAVPPVFEYPHSEGCSVTGGYVYRGPRIPQLAGAYLFTDYCDGTIRALRVEDGVLVEADLGVATRGPTSFGEDRTGELYVLSAEGVLRIDPG